MHDIVNNKLPGTCDEFIAMTNKSTYDITTRQSNPQHGPELRSLRTYQTITLPTFGTNSK